MNKPVPNTHNNIIYNMHDPNYGQGGGERLFAFT